MRSEALNAQWENVSVFFYVQLMDAEALQGKSLRPSHVRQADVDRFKMTLGARATLVPVDGRVYGSIMRLTYGEIDELYSEPSVSAYRPESVLAQMADGSADLALCFILPTPPARASRNFEYATALQAVARKMRLPEIYVARIVG